MAKLLPFTRNPTEPHLDVCLAKGEQRRRYVVRPVTPATWEIREEGPAGTARRLVSREEARGQKARFELEIATRLGAGWVVASKG